MSRTLAAKEKRRMLALEKRAYRRANGLCIKCGKEAIQNQTQCSYHRDLGIKAAARYARSEKGKVSKKNWRSTVGRYSSIRTLALRQGKNWTLSEDSWRSIISMPCFYCGLENDSGFGAGMDRLDNLKGYVGGNVVSCCYECNIARSDNFSPAEMQKIGQVIREVKLARKSNSSGSV